MIRMTHSHVSDLITNDIIVIQYVKFSKNLEDPLSKGLEHDNLCTYKGMGLLSLSMVLLDTQPIY